MCEANKNPTPNRARAKGSGREPLLIVLSGPSGVGKDTVLERLLPLEPHLRKVITVTTRAPRPGEADGSDYHFISTGRFQEMITGDELLEYAQVYGNWYGVPRTQVSDLLRDGYDVVLRTDVQGAATVKGLAPEAVTIFIAPDSLSQLVERLENRGPIGPDDQALRLKTAQDEMEAAKGFDHVVTNRQDELDDAVEQIREVLDQERTHAS